jgi:hypothetical protein
VRKTISALLVLGLTSCASFQPTAKAICDAAKTVCPLVAGTTTLKAEAQMQCAGSAKLVIVNWKKVEGGAKPIFACK